jgi:hypothetical protein
VFPLSRYELWHFGGCGVEDCLQRPKVFGGDQTLAGELRITPAPGEWAAGDATTQTFRHTREPRINILLSAHTRSAIEQVQSPSAGFILLPLVSQLPLGTEHAKARTQRHGTTHHFRRLCRDACPIPGAYQHSHLDDQEYRNYGDEGQFCGQDPYHRHTKWTVSTLGMLLYLVHRDSLY